MHSVLTRRRTLCQPSFFRWKCYRLPSLSSGRTPMHLLCFSFRQACSPRRLRTQRTTRPLPRLRSPPNRRLLLQTDHPLLPGAHGAPSVQRGPHGDIVPRPAALARTLGTSLALPPGFRSPARRTGGPSKFPVSLSKVQS